MRLEQSSMFGEVHPCRVLVVGLGGAGCKGLRFLVQQHGDGPETLGVHTDADALSRCGAARRLQLGAALTSGMSAGGDASVGQMAARNEAEAIKSCLDGYDMIVMLVGLGGGTGSGAAPVIARLARELDAFMICMAVMPFAFEGEQRRRQAERGLAQLREHSEATICFPNQRLLGPGDESITLSKAFSKADEALYDAVGALWRLLNQPSILPLDLNDVRQLVKHSNGQCTLVHAVAPGLEFLEGAVERLLCSPLLDNGNLIPQAKGLLVGIIGGPNLRLDQVQAVFHLIGEALSGDVELFSGVSVDPNCAGASVTMLVSETWILADKTVPVVSTAPMNFPMENSKDLIQADFNLVAQDKGRFTGSEATVFKGQDLDIPTYIRRNIRIGGSI